MFLEDWLSSLLPLIGSQDRPLNIGGVALDSLADTLSSKYRDSNKRLILLSSLALIAAGYILLPSVTLAFESEEDLKKRKKEMFLTKRIDKYSTSLRNPRNDCFANSTLQALSSCPSLVIYLNVFNKFHKHFVEFHNAFPFEESLPNNVKNVGNLIPLHHELSMYVYKLNAPTVYSNVISVRPFLRVIEKIFNSKFSSNQHDAHELLQVILQTLENEYLNLIKVVTIYKEDLLQYSKKIEDEKPLEVSKVKEQVDSLIEKLIIPSFPFYGYGISQFTCSSCLQKSSLSKYPFSVLSLPTPQEAQARLTELLDKAQTETINDYSCMNCKIRSILRLEKQRELKDEANGVANASAGSDRARYIEQLKNMENFCKINDEIDDKDLENFINNYQYGDFKASRLRSTIIKHNYLVKLPSIMALHLSRSIFENNQSTKNTCRVLFGKKIELSINKKIYNEYKIQENAINIDNEESEDEDEDESDNESLEDEDDANASDVDDDDDSDSPSDESDEEDNRDRQSTAISSTSDRSSVNDNDSIQNSEATPNSSTHRSNSEKAEIPESHEKANELIDMVKNLNIGVAEPGPVPENVVGLPAAIKRHHHKAKNGLVDFKLHSMIRHTGSHYYGHYECYKKKPMYYKFDNKIINKNPIINLDNIAISENSNVDKLKEYGELVNQFTDDQERIHFEHYKKDQNNTASEISQVTAVDINGNERNGDEQAISPEAESVQVSEGSGNSNNLANGTSAFNSGDQIGDINEGEAKRYGNNNSTTEFGQNDIIHENQGNEASNGSAASLRRGRSLSQSLKKNLQRLSRTGSSSSLSSLRNTSPNPLSSMGNTSNGSVSTLLPTLLGTETFDNGNKGGTSAHSSRRPSFSLSRGPSMSRSSSSVRKKPLREVKLSTVVKKPYWKTSDAEVTEVTESSVLDDNTAVYMIFYDRK